MWYNRQGVWCRHINHQRWLDAKMTNVIYLDSLESFFFVLLRWRHMPSYVMSKYGAATQHLHRLAGVDRYTYNIYTVCAWVSSCVSGGLRPLLPISPGRRPRLACHFSVWQLRARQRNEKGRRTEGRKRGGRPWIWARRTEKTKRWSKRSTYRGEG